MTNDTASTKNAHEINLDPAALLTGDQSSAEYDHMCNSYRLLYRSSHIRNHPGVADAIIREQSPSRQNTQLSIDGIEKLSALRGHIVESEDESSSSSENSTGDEDYTKDTDDGSSLAASQDGDICTAPPRLEFDSPARIDCSSKKMRRRAGLV